MVIAVSIGIDSSMLVRENSMAVRRRLGLGVGVGLHDAQRDLLVRPDEAPDVEEHDDRQPHAEAQQREAACPRPIAVGQAQRQRLERR